MTPAPAGSFRGTTTRFKTFPQLCEDLAHTLPQREAILDGEIVCLDRLGRPQFWPLMRRRGPCWFCAFDLLWLDGTDLRDLPLIERKRRLRTIVPPQPSPLLYANHMDGAGVDLFRTVCEHKNPKYSQAAGRRNFFDQARAPAARHR